MDSTALITPVLARDLAALGRLGDDTSMVSVLRGLTTALADGVPGCSGGSAELWNGDRVQISGSHSELIVLAEGERELGEGPAIEARRTGRRISTDDVLAEHRWPGYPSLAVRCGVRSVLILPIGVDPALLVIGLYSVRQAAFPAPGAAALEGMLAEQVGVALANLWDFEDARTGAAQLQEAMAGRAIIDQAKGIIMKTSGCSAEAAFEELRRVSQHHQIKVADLARLLVDEHNKKSSSRC